MSETESALKNIPGTPGKIIFLNDGDADRDGVMDHADGFSALPGADYAQSKGARFTPVVFTLPPLDDAWNHGFRLTYNASDPAAVTFDANGAPVLPPGRLRLWAKDGGVARASRSITVNFGDYIPSSTSIHGSIYYGFSNSERSRVFYLEGVAPSASIGDEFLTFEVFHISDPFTPIHTDTIRLTVLDLDLELLHRDPEDTTDIYPNASLVLTSYPVPHIHASLSQVQIDAQSNLTFWVGCGVTDRLSELTTPRVSTIEMYHEDELIETFSAGYVSISDQPWRDVLSGYGDVAKFITLPDMDTGVHLFKFVAGPNAAGQIGETWVSVVVEEVEAAAQPPVPTAELSLYFPSPPSTNTLDTAYACFGIGLPDSTNVLTEVRGPLEDMLFVGAIHTNNVVIPFELFASKPLVFSIATQDVFYARCEWVMNGMTNAIAARWEETGTNSCHFLPVEFYPVETVYELAVTRAEVSGETLSGYIEPFIVRVESSFQPTVLQTLFYPNGPLSFDIDGETLHTLQYSVDNTSSLYLSAPGTSHPRRFLATPDNNAGLLPHASHAAQYITWNLTDLSQTPLSEYGVPIIDAEEDDEEQNQTYLAPLGFGLITPLSMSQNTATTDWTPDDAWSYFELIDPVNGNFLHRFYNLVQLDVQKVPLPGKKQYDYLYFGYKDTENPIIFLSDKIPTAAEAALILNKVLPKLWPTFTSGTIWRSTGRKDLDKDYLDAKKWLLGEDDSVIQEFFLHGFKDAVPILEGAAVAAKIGYSFICYPTSLAIDISDTADYIHNGQYSKAGITAALSLLGVAGKMAQITNKPLQITKGKQPLCTITAASAQSMAQIKNLPRAQQIENLRPLIRSGMFNNTQMDRLIKDGLFKKGKTHYKELADAIGVAQQGFQNHHWLPVKFQNYFHKAGFNINAAPYGKALPKKFHTAIRDKYNKQWEKFFNGDEVLGLTKFQPDGNLGLQHQLIEDFFSLLKDAVTQTENVAKIAWPFK